MKVFEQKTYNKLIDALDSVMDDELRGRLEMSEEEARNTLKNFVEIHYLPVWRAIYDGPASETHAGNVA
jgi:hypothetical protein